MVKIAPFEVEAWMDKYETTAKYNIAETCAASISIDDLIALSENKAKSSENLSLTSSKLVYGAVRGSDALRSSLAGLYSARAAGTTKDDILITPGAIAANHLVFYSLIQAGDHVICHYPTYEQLYQVPASFGAEVSLWKADPTKKWELDIEELKSLIRPNTKMIVINNPNNPTGSIVPKRTLEEIAEIAREKDIIVLSDEVYRPLFHSIGPGDDDFPPSALNAGYNKAVVTGSLSKAYSLAGIRTGWIACRNKEILEACAATRHYTNISVSRLDEAVAAEALSERCLHSLLGRNIQLAKSNLSMLEAFIDEHQWACSWVKPVAGTTTFIKFAKMGKPVDDEVFCDQLQQKTGVMFVPGSKCFGRGQDFKGYVRIGFVQEKEVLEQGLAALRSFMEESFADLPTAVKS
jgi:aspartate/methionine/tyrosine aminotransferase